MSSRVPVRPEHLAFPDGMSVWATSPCNTQTNLAWPHPSPCLGHSLSEKAETCPRLYSLSSFTEDKPLGLGDSKKPYTAFSCIRAFPEGISHVAQLDSVRGTCRLDWSPRPWGHVSCCASLTLLAFLENWFVSGCPASGVQSGLFLCPLGVSWRPRCPPSCLLPDPTVG